MPTPQPTRSLRSSVVPLTIEDIKSIVACAKDEIIKSVNEKIESLSQVINTLSNRVSDLEDSSKTTEAKYAAMRKEFEEMKLKCSYSQPEVSDEMDQRLSRRYNLIISGLPERDDGTAGQRMEHDRKEVTKLLNDLEVEGDFTKNHRIGRKEEGRGRLMKITCASESMKYDIMKKAKHLKRLPERKNVFINPDRTPMQQKQFKEIREELKRRKEGGEDVVIYRDRVVQRKSIKNFQERF